MGNQFRMESLLKQIRETWFILIFIASLIITWTTFSSRLTQAESDIKDLKISIQELTNIKIQIQRIDTSVEFIKNRVK